jgi:hypothetical protein
MPSTIWKGIVGSGKSVLVLVIVSVVVIVSGGRVSVAVVVLVTVVVTGSGVQPVTKTAPATIIVAIQTYSARVITFK